MVILENIDIDKAILQNIDIDKISNRFKFGISNRASRQGTAPRIWTPRLVIHYIWNLVILLHLLRIHELCRHLIEWNFSFGKVCRLRAFSLFGGKNLKIRVKNSEQQAIGSSEALDWPCDVQNSDFELFLLGPQKMFSLQLSSSGRILQLFFAVQMSI